MWRLHSGWLLFMMTSSDGNIFHVTGHLCGEFTGPRWIPRTKASRKASFDIFFDLRSNKRLSKQWRSWWFETQSCPLWRHRNVTRVSAPGCPGKIDPGGHQNAYGIFFARIFIDLAGGTRDLYLTAGCRYSYGPVIPEDLCISIW